MNKLALNKSSLSKTKKQLASYQRYLPSLELKQKQLLAEKKKTSMLVRDCEVALQQIRQKVGEEFPMMASETIQLSGLASVKELSTEMENVVGVKLPKVSQLDIEILPYGKLARPHWVDGIARVLEKTLRVQVDLKIQSIRLKKLDDAVRVITQRVNLFSKVLIPGAKEDINRISLFLADQERAAVVRSKIAKKKLMGEQE